jgi:hypothetical protein
MSKNRSKNVWVVPLESGWGVRREGSERLSRITDTKKEAENIGRNIAKREHGELITQARDGKIQSKDSYGNDPNPPKDTEH